MLKGFDGPQLAQNLFGKSWFAHTAETYVLLGRDLLNRYNIGLLGPKMTLEIEA